MLKRNSWITGILLMGLITHAAKASESAETESNRPSATDAAQQVVAEATAKAEEQAAEQAIESLRDATRLELDIRLLSPTSVESANDS